MPATTPWTPNRRASPRNDRFALQGGPVVFLCGMKEKPRMDAIDPLAGDDAESNPFLRYSLSERMGNEGPGLRPPGTVGKQRGGGTARQGRLAPPTGRSGRGGKKRAPGMVPRDLPVVGWWRKTGAGDRGGRGEGVMDEFCGTVCEGKGCVFRCGCGFPGTETERDSRWGASFPDPLRSHLRAFESVSVRCQRHLFRISRRQHETYLRRARRKEGQCGGWGDSGLAGTGGGSL